MAKSHTAAFNGGKEKAKPAEIAVEKYLDKQRAKGWHYSHSGAERLYSIDVTDLLRTLTKTHPLLKHIRYTPDYMICQLNNPTKTTIWLDAKASMHVEQHAYETYMELDETRETFLAIVLPANNGKIIIVRVSDIVSVHDDWQPGIGEGRTDFNTIDLDRTKHEVVE